jgi:predicted enzyme related to lactoylglutathione lyase
VINGMHALIYSSDPEADRAFLRDTLGWSFVEDHPGWLIFRLPPGEVAVHPVDPGAPPRHELFFMCDDVQATVRDLAAKGATFAGEIREAGFGLLTQLVLPSGAQIGLYEPRHQIAADITS